MSWYVSPVNRSSKLAPYISRNSLSASAACLGIQLRVIVFIG